MERGKDIINVGKNLKSCVEDMEGKAKSIQNNMQKINAVADKAKKFTESPEMKWFMGFKVLGSK